MKPINYDCIYEKCYGMCISSIYFNVESELIEKGFDNYFMTRDEFINILKYFVLEKRCVLKFRYEINKDEASLEEQLLYIYSSFPDEIDENIPEKDVNNLWWYFSCPVDIGWKQPDGSYFISG